MYVRRMRRNHSGMEQSVIYLNMAYISMNSKRTKIIYEVMQYGETKQITKWDK